MAANAVIRLIDQYDIDPERVKFLGLGTESSTDNSAGAIIVKGMVDRGTRGARPGRRFRAAARCRNSSTPASAASTA